MPKKVAIIGSRRITEKQFAYLTSVAEAFVRRGWTVTTGCADGADYAAMVGARNVDPDQLEVYLPWASYNDKYHKGGGSFAVYDPKIHDEWTESVHKYHPAAKNLKQGAFKLHARNYGILSDVDVVVAMPMSDEDLGGTGQGMRIAKELGKKLFTVSNAVHRKLLKEFIHSLNAPPAPKLNEVKGDVFDLMKGDYDAFCITTNGVVKANGACVMGAGIAKTCRDRFKGIDMRLGKRLKQRGNHVYQLGRYEDGRILSFPVKHRWDENADIELIKQSCIELNQLVEEKGYTKVLLPRPGCGNGKLDWRDVKKAIAPILSDRIYVVTF